MLPSFVSLDHFRSRVYRSRLALVVLLILLSGSATSPSRSSSAAYVDIAVRPSSGSASPQMPVASDALIQDAATSISGLSKAASWVQQYLPVRIPIAATPAAHPPESVAPVWHPPSPVWKARSWVTTFVEDKVASDTALFKLQGQGQREEEHLQAATRGSPARLSLAILLTPTIFPTLLQLHMLWLVRFTAGEVEGRTGLQHKDLRFWPTIVTLLFLSSSIVTILLPNTTAYLRQFGDRWSSVAMKPLSPPGSLFPALPVLLLEAIPTFLSLAPLLIAVFPASLPLQVRVISPSHASCVLGVVPLWVKAPFLPAERARARAQAARGGRSRRHRDGLGSPFQRSGPTEPEAPPGDSTAFDNSGAAESFRLLQLQQDMVDELERAGRLSPSAIDQVRQAVREQARSYSGKARLQKPKQRVVLPVSYILSVLLMLSSSLSLIICYALIGLRLPTLAPTSATALVDLLALRAELGALVKYWNEERRRVEGLEFIRRRWGISTMTIRPGPGRSETDRLRCLEGGAQCSICFEKIDWINEEEDVARLDCGHELHAPCLVPWLLTQAFCPVCHRALRPGGGDVRPARGVAATMGRETPVSHLEGAGTPT
ncbi:hypothetical protein BCV69DRAFT_312360 [Microstroma glucosiphilum]|uniref:RING-type domain-containing protein n=1 Tax=Pseudomicrostroma glucosiphilum TaxID=1684307 RepID=A0A316U8D0_9BASI|nr:hypothetical protein BCV69DRAFT_312360 [Pseudomicrostroma glucosiphilum]PWN21098.1 hypothetical protein BCV69DRAFT_312360 [Pseudomicrostroma glucosiphilum]